VISLTGSQAAGQAIAAAAAPRMAALQLELGGVNPAIVTDDADTAATAAWLAEGATKLNGQWCEAPRRILVASTRHDELVDALRASFATIAIGPTGDPTTQLGPLAHRAHRDRVLAQIAGLGGETHAPAAPDDGFFLAPTLVTRADAATEIFAPVLTIRATTSHNDAIAAANSLGDGLAAYVFSEDTEHAFAIGHRLHAGEIRIGGTHLLDLAPGSAQSFWGSSGIGGHGVTDILRRHTGLRVIGEDNPTLPI
jgi:betaine-aldehyde dehydrogenase